MQLETVLSCPLGHKCQEARDNKIYKCAWLIKLVGTNPNTGTSIDEEGCAMHWTPILLIENANTSRSTSAAVESFRNEMVDINNISNKILLGAANLAKTTLPIEV